MDTALRVGFIGVGASGMPRRFLACLRKEFPHVWVAGVWEPDAAAGEAFCRDHRVPRLESPRDVADRSDVVILDVRSCATAEYASTVLEAGKALYISKPIANNLANARAVLSAARRFGAPLLATSAMRYAPGTRDAAQRLRAGDLGDLHAAHLHLLHPIDIYLAEPGSQWHVSRAGGGGPLWYLGVHAVDVLDELVGLEAIERLTNFAANLRYGGHPLFQAEGLADTNTLQIGYAHGLQATLQVACGVDHYAYGGWLVGQKAGHRFETGNDYRGALQTILEMVETGRSPLSLERMERVARVLELGTQSGLDRRPLTFETEGHAHG